MADLAAKPEEIGDADFTAQRLAARSLGSGPGQMALGRRMAGWEIFRMRRIIFSMRLKGNNLPEAHLALGDLAMARKDFAQAEQEYKAAAELVPDDFAPHLKLADFYIFRKNPTRPHRC